MPKDTFFNLEDNKRKLFLKEAYKEFSINSYEGASITNLVKSLGIAKGSVYQYFNDKEDLYRYLVGDASTRLNDLLDKACSYNNENFFEWYKKHLIVELKFYLTFPKYAKLFQQVHAGVKNVDKELSNSINQINIKRIKDVLPFKHHSNHVSLALLSKSSHLLFAMLIDETDVEQHIISEDPIFIEPTRLLDLSSRYVKQLESGLSF